MTTAVREHPILFSDEMVRAILDGRKTQTRRVLMKRLPGGSMVRPADDRWTLEELTRKGYKCPYGVPGDRLWVREPWSADCQMLDHSGELTDHWWHETPASLRMGSCVYVFYKADGAIVHSPSGYDPDATWEQRSSSWEPCEEDLEGRRWYPSIHMPRAFSRITLEVVRIRVERLQSITRADAAAEGVCLDLSNTDHLPSWFAQHRWPEENYAALWDSLNEKRGFRWASNPWVWVVEFKPIEP